MRLRVIFVLFKRGHKIALFKWSKCIHFAIMLNQGKHQILLEVFEKRAPPSLRKASTQEEILFHARRNVIPHCEHHPALSEGDIWKKVHSQGSVVSQFPRLQPIGLLLLGCSQEEGIRGSLGTCFESG